MKNCENIKYENIRAIHAPYQGQGWKFDERREWRNMLEKKINIRAISAPYQQSHLWPDKIPKKNDKGHV